MIMEATTFTVPKEIYKQFKALPEWVNRYALLRDLLGDADKIKLKPFRGERRYSDSRSAEVSIILKKALPRIQKQCERIDKIMDAA